MPTRLLRDWTDSEAVARLSADAERFFTRLIMKADDHGRYSAHPKLLRSTLFPLTFDQVPAADVVRCLGECTAAGLVRTYDHGGKAFLEIVRFGQRARFPSRYPNPDGRAPDFAGRTTGDVGRAPGDVGYMQQAQAIGSIAQAQAPAAGRAGRWAAFWKAYPKKAGRDAAAAAFARLDPDDELAAEMVAAVDWFKRSTAWREKGGRFVPRADAFINDRRWEEVPARPRPTGDLFADPPAEDQAAAVLMIRAGVLTQAARFQA